MTPLMRLNTTLLALILISGALVIVTPGAAAQVCQDPYPAEATLEPGDTIMQSGFDDGELTPLEVGILDTSFVYSAPPLTWSLEPIMATVEVEGEQDWIEIAPTKVTRPLEPPEPVRVEDHNETIQIANSVRVDRIAPHKATATIDFIAQTDEGTCVSAAPETNNPFTFTVGFYERWDATIEPGLVEARVGERVQHTVEIISESNGPLLLQIGLREEPELGSVLHPTEIKIPAWGKSEFAVDYRGEETGLDPFMLEITGTPLEDTGIELKPTIIKAVVNNQGVDNAELASPFALILPIVALLLVMNRKKNHRGGP